METSKEEQRWSFVMDAQTQQWSMPELCERLGGGDRSTRSRGVGWEVVFVCVDDYSRLAYAEVHPLENTVCAVRFFRRALRWFESLGVRCKRVLTDNTKCYGSKAFTALCDETGVRQSFTRPVHA